MPRSHRSGRSNVRAWTTSLEVLEDRALLSVSTGPVHHPAPHHTAIHQPHPAAHHAVTGSATAHAASKAVAHPLLSRVHTLAAPEKGGGNPGGGNPGTGSPPSSALTPAQTRNIYGFTAISNLGAGQTIAIVDAYDDPNIFSDADVFDKQFTTTLGGSTTYYSAYGASTSWLTKVYASGSQPSGNTGWGQEISLDVEWAHAIAPGAKILLVEARSNSFADLLAAYDYAVGQGAKVISNSWGGGESSGEQSYDSHFTASGVTFVFSAGDSGNQSYPAASPNVVAVGGTTPLARRVV